MGNLGNISGIKDYQALKAIQELDRRLDAATCQLARLRQNSSTILTELSAVTMPERSTTDVPSHLANNGSIYTKDIAGITELGFAALELYYATPEAKEGRDAFLERRPPRFRDKR